MWLLDTNLSLIGTASFSSLAMIRGRIRKGRHAQLFTSPLFFAGKIVRCMAGQPARHPRGRKKSMGYLGVGRPEEGGLVPALGLPGSPPTLELHLMTWAFV